MLEIFWRIPSRFCYFQRILQSSSRHQNKSRRIKKHSKIEFGTETTLRNKIGTVLQAKTGTNVINLAVKAITKRTNMKPVTFGLSKWVENL